MSEQQDVPGIGDNNPPPDDENPLLQVHPEKLVTVDVPALLMLHYKTLYDCKDEYVKQVDGWVQDHLPPGKENDPKAKPVIGDEQDLKDATDFVNQIKDFMKDEVEGNRKKVKAPIDVAAAAIQKYFAKDLFDVLKGAIVPIVDAQSLALAAKVERARLALKQAAWEKAQEANRLAIQSARATGVVAQESLYQQAMEVEAEAESLQAKAEGSVAELSRTRTDLQQVTGLSSKWAFKLENLIELLMAIVAGRQDLMGCVKLDDVYVNGLIKGQDGVRSIPGLHIFEEQKPR